MRKTIFIANASVLMLSGCPQIEQIAGPAPINVDVTVEADAKGVGVSREPIYVHARNGHTPIVWNVATSGYKFATNGIEIVNGGTEFDCSRKNDVVFTCIDHYAGPPATYKYWVRLEGGSGAQPPPALDPTVVNN
jgi:hypothetical protein